MLEQSPLPRLVCGVDLLDEKGIGELCVREMDAVVEALEFLSQAHPVLAESAIVE